MQRDVEQDLSRGGERAMQQAAPPASREWTTALCEQLLRQPLNPLRVLEFETVPKGTFADSSGVSK